MKIINLIEDTPGKEGYRYEHGLSFYIETAKHKVLLDTGATGAFIENAERLGIDLTEIDTVILSHGHYDHAGGIMAFAERNHSAKIYMQRTVGKPYYHLKPEMEKYIGIDERLLALPQCIKIDGNLMIDEELQLFSGIKGRRFFAQSNLSLMEKTEEGYKQDTFMHEQCLVVRSDHQSILLSGCAHNGILNILEAYDQLYQAYPDVIISGFHMQQQADYTEEEIKNIEETAALLQRTGAICYTGHCTGEKAYQIMKTIMKERLNLIHSGDRLL